MKKLLIVLIGVSLVIFTASVSLAACEDVNANDVKGYEGLGKFIDDDHVLYTCSPCDEEVSRHKTVICKRVTVTDSRTSLKVAKWDCGGLIGAPRQLLPVELQWCMEANTDPRSNWRGAKDSNDKDSNATAIPYKGPKSISSSGHSATTTTKLK
jgi:hypothetical protein